MIYRSIRITKAGLHRIQQYRDRLQVQVSQNPERFPRFSPSFRVSIDDALVYLLDQQRGHSARTTNARRTNKEKAIYDAEERSDAMTPGEVAESKQSANHR
jgi:hypothetical protein